MVKKKYFENGYIFDKIIENDKRDYKILQGEIWTCSLDGVGSELQKTRPVLVIQANHFKKSNTVMVVPITHKVKKYPFHVDISSKDFIAFAKVEGTLALEQIKTVSRARFGKRITTVKREKLHEIFQVINSSVFN